jgi:hypothetical protein
MTVMQIRIFSARMALFAIAVACVIPAQAAVTYTLVDSEGFEAPLNTTTFMGTGQLEGQSGRTDNGTNTDQWEATVGTTSTAVVQNSVFAPGGGTQAVRVDRAPDSADRWAVPIGAAPLMPYVCISWDMMIPTQSVLANGFGPVFGVEAYDDQDALDLLSFFGVDIATREVIIQDPGFSATGAFVNYDEWNNFLVTLNYTNDTYDYFLNGVLLGTTAFVDASAQTNELTDVTISALPGAGDPASLAATGTAYFDNFIVFEIDSPHPIPEPSTMILVGLGLAAIAFRKLAA